MSDFFIPVLLGTAREGRRSEPVARFVHAELCAREGVASELFDVRDMRYSATVPPWGAGGASEEPTDWKRAVERAQGIVIVVPEYNHGYPGELKLALDSLYKEYERKPAALVGVSAGGLGGARVVEHLKPVLVELSLVPTKNAAYFSKVGELFAEDGTIMDPAPHREALRKLFDELLWYAAALK